MDFRITVLLAQLASNGDCLFVTAIAKQIKEKDYPGCHLTWMIGSKFIQVIQNNPFIDEFIEIPIKSPIEISVQRGLINEHIKAAGGYHRFDHIFITDYTPINYRNWFGTTRSSLFRCYPKKISLDPRPVIYLTEGEKENVSSFCKLNGITEKTFNILFECSPQSGQSLMTLTKAIEIAEQVVSQTGSIRFILSSAQPAISRDENVIDGSCISWRENAELANYCHLLVGCSSGISWLCTSAVTKSIPFIQVINPAFGHKSISASMKIDFKYFGLPTTRLIELNNPSDEILKECIVAAAQDQFFFAKGKYDSHDYAPFSNYKFLKEAKLPLYEKGLLFLRYWLPSMISKCYFAIKPRWFTPIAWARQVVAKDPHANGK